MAGAPWSFETLWRSNSYRLISVLIALVFTTTCTSTKEVRSDNLGPEFAHGVLEVVSFTTVDGVRHDFEGGGEIRGEELLLHRRQPPGEPADRSISSSDPNASAWEYHLPLKQVSLVEVRYSDALKTTGLVLLVILVVLGVAAIIFASTAKIQVGLCPFIYSFDGKHYVFDGEPYGGAVSRALARTDWSELEHLREVEGKYRLLLTNEVDETQHTDSLALLVVDHRPDEQPVMGYDGQTHLFRQVQSPASAYDELGRDLLPFVRAVDGVSWTPELTSVAERLPLADVRNHVTLEFRRPPGVKRAWLLANVATGPWGGAQLRTLLGMRGAGVEEWMRAVDASPELQRQLRAWDEREELFHLGVEVQVGNRWERRAVLLGGAPLRSQTRAVAVDLIGVEGETVRLRIHPPISFWRFESFQLAWEERAVRPRVLLPRFAQDERGQDVRSLLSAQDGVTLDQPPLGAVTRVEFDAPPIEPGKARTVFARTHGWYELHFHGLGAPETANLARLENEPGYAVRRALDDFVEFRRSGRLPYALMPSPDIARGDDPR
jgi:hypothetical protein